MRDTGLEISVDSSKPTFSESPGGLLCDAPATPFFFGADRLLGFPAPAFTGAAEAATSEGSGRGLEFWEAERAFWD